MPRTETTTRSRVQLFMYPPRDIGGITTPDDFDLDIFFKLVSELPPDSGLLSKSQALHRRLKDGWTYKAIGDEVGLSAERVRQVCNQARRKMRLPSRRPLYEMCGNVNH